MYLLSRIENELSGFIEFGGLMDTHLRTQMVKILYQHFYDPMFSGISELDQSELNHQYPKWSSLIRQLMQEEELRSHTVNNEEFALSVTREALNWFRQTYIKMEGEDDLEGEEKKLAYMQKHAEDLAVDQWEELLEEVKEIYPFHQRSWNFYLKQLRQLSGGLSETDGNEEVTLIQQEKRNVLRKQVLEDWRKFFVEKRNFKEESFLHGEFTDYYNSLKQKIDQLDLIGDLLSPYYSFFGHAWSNSLESWESINWDKLTETARELAKDPHLQTLAELLGRWQMHDTDQKLTQMASTRPKAEYIPNPFGKSEIAGVHHSDQLSAMLPSEISLLGSPETEIVFAKKFVEKKLLTFQYKSTDFSIEYENIIEEVPQTDFEEKGPIIMCIDTSGSMYGEPERIAKALAFGILDIALKANRKAYVISFSTTIAKLELTGMEKDFQKMVDFLQMSFHGGTDLQPPLREALKMLDNGEYTQADVLVISDFVLPAMDRNIFDKIQTYRQEKGTHFHSLLITRRPDPRANTLAIFDHHWVYDLDNPKVLRQMYDHFEELRTHMDEAEDNEESKKPTETS